MLTRKLYGRPNTRISLYLGICGEERHRSFQSPYPATHQQTQNSRKSQQRATNASSSNDLGRSNQRRPKKRKKVAFPSLVFRRKTEEDSRVARTGSNRTHALQAPGFSCRLRERRRASESGAYASLYIPYRLREISRNNRVISPAVRNGSN